MLSSVLVSAVFLSNMNIFFSFGGLSLVLSFYLWCLQYFISKINIEMLSSVLVAGVLSDQKVSEKGDLHLSCQLAAGQVCVYHLFVCFLQNCQNFFEPKFCDLVSN